MGNIINAIKKFISNKNTVTILGVLAGIVVLWGFYSYRVNKATTPIKVPYAKEVISAASEITQDVIGYAEINSKFLSTADIIQNANELIGKYVTTGTSIPKGGLFYREQVVEKGDLPNTFISNIEDGNTAFSLEVNNHTTYGNAIYPGDKIDLYMEANDESGKLVYGKFIESITVLAVRDSTGRNVFDTNPPRTPSELAFSVDNDMYTLLYKASRLSGVKIVPVPRNENYTTEGGSVKTYEYFKNLIEARTGVVEE